MLSKKKLTKCIEKEKGSTCSRVVSWHIVFVGRSLVLSKPRNNLIYVP